MVRMEGEIIVNTIAMTRKIMENHTEIKTETIIKVGITITWDIMETTITISQL